ncbi:helix-turn-helix domain-containing protein [Paraburkholderia sp. RL17-383-BIF-A]|uniref:helix-turn-helix domain-containing protein n=1 Tax=Paraburkholderia sp. RL17-383-BIF-A TaxID=3031631 RepID=UPI0038B7D0F2
MSTNLPRESLGDRIRHIRSARGWSQAHLAELVGMKKAQLSRYEVGASAPRPEVVHRIASALGVSQAWLADGEAPINDHEIPDEKAKTVPLTPKAMDTLFALATKTGLSITEVIELALKDALQRARTAESAAKNSGVMPTRPKRSTKT